MFLICFLETDNFSIPHSHTSISVCIMAYIRKIY
jgi:hypothetical protein